MLFTIPRNTLIPALERCAGTCAKKGAMPVLEHLLLTVMASGAVQISGTDLYRATSTVVPATNVRQGAASVDAKHLISRVSALPVGDVTVEIKSSDQLEIRAEGSKRRFRLWGLPGSDFPKIATAPADASWSSIEAKRLAWLIQSTEHAMSKDVNRPNVHSTFLEWKDDHLAFVATDGHRLARAQVQMPEKRSLEALVARDAIEQIGKLINDVNDSVRFCVHGAQLFIEVGGYGFSTKLVGASFPPYQHILGEAMATPSSTVVADRNKLRELMAAMQVSAKSGVLGVTLRPGAGDDMMAKNLHGMLIVQNQGTDTSECGDCSDHMDVDYRGPLTTVGVTSSLLTETLASMPEGNVELHVAEPTKPIRVVPSTQGEGAEVVAIVMPAMIGAVAAVAA